MKKLWTRFDKQVHACYSGILSENQDKSVWDEAFDALMDLIQSERQINADYAKELYEIDEETEYEHDVAGFLEDYLDELGMYRRYDQLYEVCKKLLDMFAWSEDEPTDIKFELAEALKGLERYGEAVAFCERWHKAAQRQSWEAETVSAAALIYAQIRTEEYAGAEEVVKKYISDGAKCEEENEVVWRAAVRLYEAMNDKRAKKMKKELEKYEEKIDRELEAEFGDLDDFIFSGDDDWDFVDYDDMEDDEWDMEDDELPFS